jgi:hypothetical protein
MRRSVMNSLMPYAPPPQQETLALRLPQVFVGVAAQHGNLVQLTDFRGPAAH